MRGLHGTKYWNPLYRLVRRRSRMEMSMLSGKPRTTKGYCPGFKAFSMRARKVESSCTPAVVFCDDYYSQDKSIIEKFWSRTCETANRGRIVCFLPEGQETAGSSNEDDSSNGGLHEPGRNCGFAAVRRRCHAACRIAPHTAAAQLHGSHNVTGPQFRVAVKAAAHTEGSAGGQLTKRFTPLLE